MTLEQKLLDAARKGNEVDIETALLAASGVREEGIISEYKAKIADIDGRLKAYCKVKNIKADTPLKKAIALHRFFFDTNPKRAKPAEYAEARDDIAKAIDAQLSLKNEPIGSCVALTALYTMLAIRNGISVYVLSSPTHVLSRIRDGCKSYDIENTKLEGIGKRDGNSYQAKGPEAIVAAVYANNASMLIKEKRYDDAIEECNKALAFDKKDSGIYLNRGAAKMKKGELKSAWLDFRTALEINPEYRTAARALKAVEKKINEQDRQVNDKRISFCIGQSYAALDGSRVHEEAEKRANDKRIRFLFGEQEQKKQKGAAYF